MCQRGLAWFRHLMMEMLMLLGHVLYVLGPWFRPICFWEHLRIPQEKLEDVDNHTPNTVLPNWISGRKWMNS